MQVIPEDPEIVICDFGDVDSLETFEAEDDLIRKYFPDVWIFENFEMQRPTAIHSQVVPDTITTWKLSGFSISPEFGLAISEPHSVKVFQDFFIKVGVPNSVKIGEMFKVDVTVHNYLDYDLNVDISIDNGEFELINERQKPGKPEGCMEYSKNYRNSKTVAANSQAGASTEFLLKAVKSGSLKLKIDADARNARDSVEKTIKVDYDGATQYKSHPMLIDLRSTSSFNKDFNVEIPRDVEPYSVKIEASLSGNLLGPAIENVERLM